MMNNYPKLLRIPDWRGWDHHRSGWRYALQGLHRLHNDNGIWCNSFLDQFFIFEDVQEPWTGFFHNAPFHPSFSPNEKYKYGRELDAVLDSPKFRTSYPHCRGLFTVSNYVKKYLETRVSVPVSVLVHPSDAPDLYFSYDAFIRNPRKKLVVTGQWMRRYETIYFIHTTKYEKCILNCDYAQDWDEMKKTVGGDLFRHVTLLEPINNTAYDVLLERNIVFLDLYDVAACNSIIDCMVRNTPVLTRRLPGNVDYLGEDYPFYFRDVEEATKKLHDFNLIRETTEYLKQLPIKEKMTLDSFVQQIAESEVYKALVPKKFVI